MVTSSLDWNNLIDLSCFDYTCAFQTYLRWTSYSCDSHYIVIGCIQGAYTLLDFDIIQILSFPEDNWSKVWLSAKMIYLKTNLPLLSFISKCILVGNWFELTSNTSLSFSSSNLDDALQKIQFTTQISNFLPYLYLVNTSDHSYSILGRGSTFSSSEMTITNH